MPYNEALANRIRQVLAREDVLSTERHMFGGICVLVKGNMAIGVNKDDLMVRVGAEEYEEALRQPHARPMDFTGRPLKGFVYVGPAGYETEGDLRKWVMKAVRHAESLGPKKRKR